MAENQGEMFPYPEHPWLRYLFRSPLLAWRLGLGSLLGQILVVLTARGRKSGKPRRTVVEYLPLRGNLYVVAAYAPRADWYRNIMAHPYVTAQTWQGAESLKATRVTEADELRAVLEHFRRRNPVMVDWYLKSLGLDPQDIEEVLAHRDQIYILRLAPTAAATPPPLRPDLVWVWLVALGAMLLIWRLLNSRRKR
jgi:deazaflavin-dependent oxidoreductase (nitroreductase family)